MLSAALRLALIATISVFVFIIGLAGLRTLGSMQTFGPVRHPWMDKNFLLIVKKDCAIEDLLRTDKEHPGAIHFVSLKSTPEELWEVECAPNYPLRDLLQRMPKSSFLFHIRSSGEIGLESLSKEFLALENNASIGLTSPSHFASKKLRKRFPQWLFGADPTTLVKLRFLESLYIETVADVWPDFFITTNDSASAEFLSPRLIEELMRRKKLIIWNDSEPDNNLTEKLDPHVRGVMTNRPTWAAQEFRSRF